MCRRERACDERPPPETPVVARRFAANGRLSSFVLDHHRLFEEAHVPKKVKLKNLAAATAASVKAALGRPIAKRPGTLAGFILRDAEFERLGKSPAALAKEVATGVRLSSGIRVTAGIARVPGGILVGYQVPALFK